MKGFLLIFLISLSFPSLKSNCQQIKYYQPFDTIDSKSYFYPVGNIHGKQLVLKLFSDEFPQLLIFNDSGRLVAQRSISIPELKNTVIPKIVAGRHSWVVVMQHQEGNNIYLATARLNENGDLLQPYTRIDSSRADKLGDGSYYHFSLSNDKSKVILHRMILGLQKDKFLIDYLALTNDGELIERGSHYISYQKESEDITPLFQHTNGKTYFAIYNKPGTATSSSKITIYQLTPSVTDLLVKKIDFSGTKPIQPVFAANSSKDELSFVSLYNDLASQNPKGLLIAKINLNKETEDPAISLLPFAKTRKGETELGKDGIKLGYKEKRGDNLTIASSSFMGEQRALTILFENRFTSTSSEVQTSSTIGQTESMRTVWGQSNLTPSQEFDLLRNYATTPATVNQLRAGNGSFYVLGLKTAPVSTQHIYGGPWAETLSDNYRYSTQPIQASGERIFLEQERTLLQFDLHNNPLRKNKLSINFGSGDPGVEAGNIVSPDELIILNYTLNSTDSFIMQLFDTVNPAYQALLYNINGYKPFYSNSFSLVGKKKIYTLFTTADNKKIGLAEISW